MAKPKVENVKVSKVEINGKSKGDKIPQILKSILFFNEFT